MFDRSADEFTRDTLSALQSPTQLGGSPGGTGQSNFMTQVPQQREAPKEIVEIRYNHYQSKRRKYFEQIGKLLGLIGDPRPPRGFNAVAPQQTSKWKPFSLKQSGTNIHKHATQHNGMLPQISSSKQLHINTSLHSSMLHQGNQSFNEDLDLTHIINSGTTKFKKVGRAGFGHVMTPSNNQSTMQSTKNTYRSHISTPENYFKVTQQLIQTQIRMNKEQARVERFKQVRQNAMQMAEQKVQQIQGKILKDYKNQERFQKYKVEVKEEDHDKRQKLVQKHHIAQVNFTNTLKQLDKRSLSGYSLKMKEVAELTQKKVQKDKSHSQRHYEYLKHKIEEEEMLWKKRNEIRRQENEEIDVHLQSFEKKMSRGQSIADNYRRETSSKASRVSANQLETLRQHSQMYESNHTKSLEKVLKKDSAINNKIKKKRETNSKLAKTIRESLNLRFERNKSARSMVSDEYRKKGKLTLERLHQKDRLKEILIERQQLETQKHREIYALKRADHLEELNKEHALMNEFKVRVARKLHNIDAAKRDIEYNKRIIQAASPHKSHLTLTAEERHVIEQMNPKAILNNARMNLTMQLTGELNPQAVMAAHARNQRKKFQSMGGTVAGK